MATGDSSPNPVIHLIQANQTQIANVDQLMGRVQTVQSGVQMLAGFQAFRQYDPLFGSQLPLNAAGNFRGMVVNSSWRTIFQHVSTAGDYLDNLGYLTSFAGAVADSVPALSQIAASSNSASIKGLQYAAVAGTAAQRAILGAIPSGVHMIYFSLEGWCMLAGLAGGPAQSVSSSAVQTLQQADTLVQTTFKTVTDTSVQASFLSNPLSYVSAGARQLWTVVNMLTSAR